MEEKTQMRIEGERGVVVRGGNFKILPPTKTFGCFACSITLMNDLHILQPY